MFLFVFGVRRHVRATAAGTFFCLRCKADRAYQLREWRETMHFVGIPLPTSTERFVLCATCKTAFDPECLDESSTAEPRELEVYAPEFAYKVLRNPTEHELSQRHAQSLSQYLGRDSLYHEETPSRRDSVTKPKAPSMPLTPEIRAQRQAPSARSRSRKH
jgi:hypothetical protein